MAVTLAQMTAYIQVIIQQQLTDQQVTMLVNLAELEEIEARSWASMQAEVSFNSFALYTTGTITVTNGSPVVTGSGTVWTSNMAGMVMRAGTSTATATTQLQPINIDSVQSATQLTLQDPYPLATQSALGYQIFPLFYSIPALNRVMGVRQQIILGRRTHDWINTVDPYRYNQSSPARFWAPFGNAHNGNAKVELWPIETSANPYTAFGIKQRMDLANPSDTPTLPSGVVMNKAIVKCCETLNSLTGDQRWSNQRDYYFGVYQNQLERAIDSDNERFGVTAQIRDSYTTPDSDGYTPGLDYFWNRGGWQDNS